MKRMGNCLIVLECLNRYFLYLKAFFKQDWEGLLSLALTRIMEIIMKNNLKRKITSILCSLFIGTSALTFTGCSLFFEDDFKKPNIEKPVGNEQEKIEQQKQKFEDAVGKVRQGNFELKKNVSGREENYICDGDKLKIGDRYYYKEGTSTFYVEKKDGLWNKFDATRGFVDLKKHEIYEFLYGVQVSNIEGNSIVAKLSDGTICEIEIDGSNMTVASAETDLTYAFSNIGNTKLQIPTAQVDNTSGYQQQEDEATKEVVEKMYNLASRLSSSQNYTFTITENGKKKTYKFNKDVLQIIDSDGSVEFITNDNGKKERYFKDGGTWKKESTNKDVSNINWLINVEISNADYSYSTETGTLSATLRDGKIVTIAEKNGEYTFSGSGFSFSIKDVEQTKTDEIPNVSKRIYTIQNGQYVFDVVAIRDVLEPWLKGDNQWGKDYYKIMRKSDETHTEHILYINATKDGIKYGLCETIFNKPYFGEDEISGIGPKIQDGTIQTQEDFRKYLFGLERFGMDPTVVAFRIEYSTLSDDYSTNRDEFEKLTKGLFKNIEETGCKKRLKDTETTKVTDYKGATIVFGYKTKYVDEGYMDWIIHYSWRQGYIVRKSDGSFEMIEFEMHAYGDDGKAKIPEYVVNQQTNLFYIRPEIDKIATIKPENSVILPDYKFKDGTTELS